MFLDLGGTVRAATARETLARIEPLLPRFGITRLAAAEGLLGIRIPVTLCFRPNAPNQSTSQGKGITRELADVSALMEAIELCHAERLPPASATASVIELRRRGRAFIDPATLTVLPQASLYSDQEPLGWLTLRRLSDGGPILMPRFYLDLDRSAPRPEIGSHAFDVTSTGLASGNTLDEAIVHGLYELIERHCFAAYMTLDLATRRTRAVALETIGGSPHLDELVRRLAEVGLTVGARAIHNRLGIPAFRVRIQPVDPDDHMPPTPGFGAHFVPEVALARAITEAVQGKVTQIMGVRDDAFPHTYHYVQAALALRQPRPPLAPASLAWRDVPRPPRFASFAEVLAWTLAVLARNGIHDTCYLDLARPELGNLAIVFVVSAGLPCDRDFFYRPEQD